MIAYIGTEGCFSFSATTRSHAGPGYMYRGMMTPLGICGPLMDSVLEGITSQNAQKGDGSFVMVQIHKKEGAGTDERQSDDVLGVDRAQRLHAEFFLKCHLPLARTSTHLRPIPFTL